MPGGRTRWPHCSTFKAVAQTKLWFHLRSYFTWTDPAPYFRVSEFELGQIFVLDRVVLAV